MSLNKPQQLNAMVDSDKSQKKTTSKNKAAPGQVTVAPQRYNEFVRGAGLVSLRLISSEFNMKPAHINAYMSGKETDFSINEEDAQIKYDSDKGSLVVIASWEVRGATEEDTESLFLRATYVALFKVESGFEDNEAIFFGNKVGVSTIYPYFRQHLSHVNAESGADIPLAPIRKVVPVKVRGRIKNEII